VYEHIKLQTLVSNAVQLSDGRWSLTLQETDEEGHALPKERANQQTETFDKLVVCSGVFSGPYIPSYSGRATFEAAGGELIHSSELADIAEARNKRVVVIGYGKSACDVAAETAKVANSTTVIARHIIWKLPRVILNVVPYQLLLLTRLGEALFLYKNPGLVARILNGPLHSVRQGMLDSLGWASDKQYGISKLGLLPPGKFEEIACASITLVTEGFFEQVHEGTITVRREREISELGTTADGAPGVVLDDGETFAADLVIAGTGWKQHVPFLSSDVHQCLIDERGNFVLYRGIQPAKVDNLFFNGYNSSLFSPTSAGTYHSKPLKLFLLISTEMAALWIASAMKGALSLPPATERHREAKEWVDWLHARGLKHAYGTSHVPFSLAVIDDVLADLGESISTVDLVAQWLLPVRPAAYQPVVQRVLARLQKDS